jgi:hypothetical protein
MTAHFGNGHEMRAAFLRDGTGRDTDEYQLLLENLAE